MENPHRTLKRDRIRQNGVHVLFKSRYVKLFVICSFCGLITTFSFKLSSRKISENSTLFLVAGDGLTKIKLVKNGISEQTTASLGTSKESEQFKRTHFMTVQGNGRLGNQMFQVASLICTAIRNNYTPFIKTNHMINRYFDIKYRKDVRMTNTATIGESKAGAYDPKIDTLSHDKNWTLSGYFQSWKYFHKCKNEIRSLFQFKPTARRKATEKIQTIYSPSRPVVGVHVRRSDMASSRETKRGYNVATPEFINKSLTYFRANYNKPLFVVVSDDRRWSTSHVKGTDVIYAGSGSIDTDLALLSLCNHSIVTSGSFGWWGAYLSGGKTVYFSNYPGRGSWLATQYEHADYYPPEWVGLE